MLVLRMRTYKHFLTKPYNTMELQHINNEGELADVLQVLPAGVQHLIIDALGLPAGIVKAEENLTDYVHRVQDRLVRA